MREFWQLINILLCLAGFLITGGSLLAKGVSFFESAVRASITLAVLYVVLNTLGSVLVSVTASKPPASFSPGQETGEESVLRD